MHAAAQAVSARIDQATFTDDGLEVTRSWDTLTNVTGHLTPIDLATASRLGLTPTEATHTLVLGNGLPFTVAEYRVVIASRVYDVVRVTNLPTRSIIVLRGTAELESGGS
jgi:hypothetical protein